ncbi:adenosylcobinamide-phosphate synthase CbiB [Phenylobacterium sp.]|uniref:adenosylcobinamide-phosphate synthase CbiB n=1 Tax=Phenylobacterium sp. TaxID=1871053 RepID=UPI0027328CCC|nr:adenosylcobinamide-phosphate synthase CbiB [Phenylobacterium sp.]MDP3659317.1 adenosylcobinamide-phosphate synthase CbiB [Phenylobacterium sp.]
MAADPWIVLGAGLLEGVTGYPQAVHRRAPHPVTWAGGLIGAAERTLNRGSPLARRAAGIVTLLLVVGLAAGLGLAVERLSAPWAFAPLALIAAGSLGLAGRNLYVHVAAVHRPLGAGDLEAARVATARIVGRDVERLDAGGLAGAALESLAESFNDAVAAPLFWFLVAGLPGLFAYKAVNTADSLIGHREAPFTHFGWAAARTDDLMNLVPARLAGGAIALGAGRGWRIMLRDAGKHASPNAGWPEAAMAGALGVRLGGTASYDGTPHLRPTLGEGPAPAPLDLARGLGLYLRACAILVAALAFGGVAWPR